MDANKLIGTITDAVNLEILDDDCYKCKVNALLKEYGIGDCCNAITVINLAYCMGIMDGKNSVKK